MPEEDEGGHQGSVGTLLPTRLTSPGVTRASWRMRVTRRDARDDQGRDHPKSTFGYRCGGHGVCEDGAVPHYHQIVWVLGARVRALLDAVSGAIGQLDQVQLERAPRMADFARWIAAAEPALGWPTGSFLRAYTGNRDAIHEIALDAAVIVPSMRTLLDSGEFVGTATELLDRLAGIVGETATRRKGWPGNATSLSRELAPIAPNLRSVGIEVEKAPRVAWTPSDRHPNGPRNAVTRVTTVTGLERR